MQTPLPNLKLLQVFITVARCGGYARAQQALNMTTPAISGYMSELEAQLGFVLCQRGRAGFSLTDKGRHYLESCQQLQESLGEFARQTGALQAEQGGRLAIGVVDAIATDQRLGLARLIGEFNQRYPAIYLSLTLLSPGELQQQVLDDRLDLAVGHFPLNMNNLIAHPLHQEPHGLYCGRLHPLFAQHDDHIDVDQQRFVTRSYWNQAEVTRRGFRHSAASVQSIEAQLILIQSGRFIGYLPEHYARQWVAQGELRRLAPARFDWLSPFSLIYRRGRSRETLIRAFRDRLLARLRDEVEPSPESE